MAIVGDRLFVRLKDGGGRSAGRHSLARTARGALRHLLPHASLHMFQQAQQKSDRERCLQAFGDNVADIVLPGKKTKRPRDPAAVQDTEEVTQLAKKLSKSKRKKLEQLEVS